MVYQAEDRTKAKRQQAEAAIQAALEGRWQEAVQINRTIVQSFPTDVDAFNRLGKAMTELGKYAEARDSYMRALEIDSLNTIARKNLTRLATLGEAAPPRPASQKLSPQMFIEEMGKTGVTVLVNPNMSVAARMTAGDQVNLQRQNRSLAIESLSGEHMGDVETRLAQRLIKLMDGGNTYVAAISAMGENEVRVFIRETFQDATQTGKLSFPPTVTESFRPYTKSRLVRHDADDDTYIDDGDSDDWGHPDAEDADEDATGFGATDDDAVAGGDEMDDEQ